MYKYKILSFVLAAIMVTVSLPGMVLSASDQNASETPTKQPLTSNMFAEYTNRYIVKYAEPGTALDESSFEDAFSIAKSEKEAAVTAFQASADDKEAERIVSSLGKKPSATTTFSDESDIKTVTVGEQYEVIQLSEKVEPDHFIEKLNETQDTKIEYIQPDYPLELLDYQELEQTAENEAELSPTPNPEITDNAQRSKTLVTVALIDTAVDTQHPELSGHLAEGFDFITNSKIMTVDPNSTADFHGTHIAGLIASTAPEAQIMPLKVFQNGRAYTSDIIRAIEYAKSQNIKIMNCSWGSADNNAALKEAMSESGMIFVCAAGNNGRSIDEKPVYPAAFDLDNIISVASVNSDMGLSYFSNYGIAQVDIAASGRNVESTVPGGQRGTMNGTSASAGLVSGALALYGSSHNFNSAKQDLLSSSDKVSCLQDKVLDGNLLNVQNLLSDTEGQEVLAAPQPDTYGVPKALDSEGWELFSTTKTIKVKALGTTSVYLKEDGSLYMYENYVDDNGSISNKKDMSILFHDIVDVTIGEGINDPLKTVYFFAHADGRVSQYDITTRYDENRHQILDGVTNITSLYGKGLQVFAKTAGGDVWSWGPNQYGEACYGVWDEIDGCYITNAPPTKITSLTGVESIYTGDRHSYAIDQGHNLLHWGFAGGWADGSECSPEPILLNVRDIGIIHQMDDLYQSREYVLVLCRDGSLKYFENGVFDMETRYERTFYTVSDDSIKDVAKLDDEILLKNNGTVFSWNISDNNPGHAGGETISFSPVDGLSGAVNIFESNHGYAALLQNMTVMVWGSNYGDRFGVNGDDYIPTPLPVSIPDGNAGKVLLVDEQYNQSGNAAYKANQEKLESMGWEEGYYYGKGDITAETGQLVIRKTSPQMSGDTELIYDVTKKFTAREDNWRMNDRVSVWTQHFKGKYAIRLKGSFHQSSSQVYYDLLDAEHYGSYFYDNIAGRYRIDPGTNGDFSVNNYYLNQKDTMIYPLWKNPQINRIITTEFDTNKQTFQTFLNSSSIPAKTTIKGADPDDTFQMTDWTPKTVDYFTGIRISAQNQAPAKSIIAKLDSVQLIEKHRERDIVDDAIDTFDMSDVTDTPEAVTSSLKPLPDSRCGAEITWTSSRPDLLADDGTLLRDPLYTTDVVMTANVTNPEDKFTKHIDFRLTLPRQKGFEETYTNSFTGTPSSAGSEGTKSFSQLPMWKFSYPGISNGANGEIHAAQVLEKDGYLVFKKISDRQTANYKECLVGTRSLHDSQASPRMIQTSIGFTAKVSGTGTMRFAPLTEDGKPVCTVILDASTKHIEVTYGKKGEDGEYVKETARYDNIDPTTEHNYELILYPDHTFWLYVDNKLVTRKMHYVPDAGDNLLLSEMKIWITNVTYKDTEIGMLKRFIVSNDKRIDGKLLQNSNVTVTKDSIYDIALDNPLDTEKLESYFNNEYFDLLDSHGNVINNDGTSVTDSNITSLKLKGKKYGNTTLRIYDK